MKIENWIVVPGLYGNTNLTGNVFGHVLKADGKDLRTTPVIAFNKETKTARTYSGSVYELGEPGKLTYSTRIGNDIYNEVAALDFLEHRVSQFLDAQKLLKRVKKEKVLILKWPSGPHEYKIYTDDVLVKGDVGYTKLSGLCMTDLDISDDEVENFDKVICLEMM